MNILVAYILFACILIIDLYTDYMLIVKGQIPMHVTGAMQRGLALIVCSAIASQFNVLAWALWTLHLFFLFWILFDAILNKLRGKKLLYVGYTAVFDMVYREMFKKPEYPLLITKLTLFALTTIPLYLWIR